MTRFLARCALVTVALVGLPWAGSALGTAITGVSDTKIMNQPADLYEDDPAWDCRTMGNGACGPSIDTAKCGPIGNPLGCPTWEPAK